MRLWRNLFLRLTTPADFAIVALATTAEKACTLTLAHFRHFRHFSSLFVEHSNNVLPEKTRIIELRNSCPNT